MIDYTLSYFDMAGSRGEEVRLAFAIAGVPFHDNRISRDAFAAMKPDLPFGTLPMLEVEGRGAFFQTNAILRLIGRRHGLYPADAWDAARHDAVMEAVEDLRTRIGVTIRMADPQAVADTRRSIVADVLPPWGRGIEALIGDDLFVGGDSPGLADIKLHILHRWISGGVLDHFPADALDAFPRLTRAAAAVATWPAVVAWSARALPPG